MDDELAAFDAELRALESSTASSADAAKPAAGPRAPKVISSAPVRSAAVMAAGTVAMSAPLDGKRVPPSQWATPDQITSTLRSEGLVVPTQSTGAASLPEGPASFIVSAIFSGQKYGYVFKAGDKGVGYYHESALDTTGGSSSAMVRPGGGGGSSSMASAMASSMTSAVGAGSGDATLTQAAGPSKGEQRNMTRTVAGMVWQDKTLAEWPEDDFRVFIGDLGNEVNDDVLAHAFQKYPSFQRARVVRDGKSSKTKGYGFVSFRDPWDMTKALREMNGKYVGNRPIKVRKTTSDDHMLTADNQPLEFKHALGVADKAVARQFKRGGAIHTQPGWKKNKKQKGSVTGSVMPW